MRSCLHTLIPDSMSRMCHAAYFTPCSMKVFWSLVRRCNQKAPPTLPRYLGRQKKESSLFLSAATLALRFAVPTWALDEICFRPRCRVCSFVFSQRSRAVWSALVGAVKWEDKRRKRLGRAMVSGCSAFSEATEKFGSATLCSLLSAVLVTNSPELHYPWCIFVTFTVLITSKTAQIFPDRKRRE